MNEYKRLVSYMYSYSGGVKDKNVGFAKTEVRDGMFKLNMSLKGVYTDAPESFGVYLVVDKNAYLHIGNIMVSNGVGKYEDLLNAGDINNTGYTYKDVCGVAVTREKEHFYVLLGMWDDAVIDMSKVRFISKEYRTGRTEDIEVEETVSEPEEEYVQEYITEAKYVREMQPEEILPEDVLPYTITVEDGLPVEEADNVYISQEEPELSAIPQMEELFKDGDFINAFSDDYLYDCVEVTLEQLKDMPIGEEEIVSNTFLEHGYYNFRHVLFGRVQKNEKHTEYFIGVPGMYCNRERFMASMFGFNNFKKSHRSDYSNPYFGYWYQEI